MQRLSEYTFRNKPKQEVFTQFDKYLDGGIYRLVRGKDFRHKTGNSFISGLRYHAKGRGKFIKTQVEDDNTIVIQALERK